MANGLLDFSGMDAFGSLGAGLLNASQGGSQAPGDILMSTAVGKYLRGQQPDPNAPQRFQGTNPQYQIPAPSPTFTGGGDELSRLMHSIGRLESGNRYDVTGPRTKTGDRAYGRYQVMGANIPSWTREVLGQPMTVQEFMSNPAAQDAVAKAKLGAYLKQYGNINDAASMWFSGRPSHGNTSRDVTGTSVPQYIATVNRYY